MWLVLGYRFGVTLNGKGIGMHSSGVFFLPSLEDRSQHIDTPTVFHDRCFHIWWTIHTFPDHYHVRTGTFVTMQSVYAVAQHWLDTLRRSHLLRHSRSRSEVFSATKNGSTGLPFLYSVNHTVTQSWCTDPHTQRDLKRNADVGLHDAWRS